MHTVKVGFEFIHANSYIMHTELSPGRQYNFAGSIKVWNFETLGFLIEGN
jgi:hypothetical protein